MEARNLVKIGSLVTVIALVTSFLSFQVLQNSIVPYTISTSASVIDVVLFALWLLRKEPAIEKVVEKIEPVLTFVETKEQEYVGREKIIKALVSEGIIRYEDLVPLIKHKEFLCVFCYGEGLPQRVTEIYGGDGQKGQGRQPLLRMLQGLGFTRVVGNQNLLIAPLVLLARNLRTPEKLNRYIKEKLPAEWSRISELVKERYPKEKYKILEKWRTGQGFDVTYLIWKAPAEEFLVDYVKKSSFPPQVIDMISKSADTSRLRNRLKARSVEVTELLPRVSLAILLDGMDDATRQSLLDHESDIKQNLKITKFTDYKQFVSNPRVLVSALSQYLTGQSEVQVTEIANAISSKSHEFAEVLSLLGVEVT